LKYKISIALVCAVLLSAGASVLAHDAPQHVDPDLLTGWLTWVHLTIQWLHLVGFALWFGVLGGTLLLKLKTRLDPLLYTSWFLYLVIVATGVYNMDWSAGIPETPSLYMLPLLHQLPYGVSYTLALTAKVAVFAVAVLLTLIVTFLHLGRRIAEAELQRFFLIAGVLLGLTVTLMASVVLLYHEAADLWPTRLHSAGGVLSLHGKPARVEMLSDLPPNDFELLMTPSAWVDIVLRWMHLVGFGLWTGGMLATVIVGGVSPGRFLVYSWSLLFLQIVSGSIQMERWAPFQPAPYIWNLEVLSHLRFGRLYTLLMAVKHGWFLIIVGLLLTATVLHRRRGPDFSVRGYALAGAVAALAISYIMMMVLLVHEGVDHAL
jgi:hypothetical protein